MKKSIINYNDILSYQKVYNTYFDIKKTTKNKKVLLQFQLYLNTNIYNLLLSLYKEEIQFSKYNIFLIKEPKYRIIMSQQIDDKIINHLVARYFLLPSLERGLIDTNVATRKNRGSKYAFELVKKFVRSLSINEQIYVLKLDISKYFYNIDHTLLYNMIQNKIKDKKCLNIIKKIIDTTDEEYVNNRISVLVENEIKKLSKFKNNESLIEELKSIPLYKKGKGLPLGNMTSQILAIFYMDSIDKYIKEELKHKYYVRYMDDLLIFSSDKNKLIDDFRKIDLFVDKLKLKLNSKSKLYSLNNGIDFVGYRFKYNKHRLIIKYRKATYSKLKNNLRYKKNNCYKNYLLSKSSYKGYLIKTNTIYKSKYKNIEKEPNKKKIRLLDDYYLNAIVIHKINNRYYVYDKNVKSLKGVLNMSYSSKHYFFSVLKVLRFKNVLREKNINFVIVSGNSFNEEIYNHSIVSYC